MNLVPRQVLRQLLADYGLTLLGEPARVNALLADLCETYPRERFLLVYALRERIPAELQNQPQDGMAHRLRLSQRLQKRYGFSAEAALWAVESWSLALNADSPEEEFALTDKPFSHVEEVILQILAQEPLSSHEVATVLKTTRQQAAEWLQHLQELEKVESIWLKQRSPHYAFYKVVSSEERIAAEVAARKRAEDQIAAEAVTREIAEKRAEAAEKWAEEAKEKERQKLKDRIDAENSARLKAERRAESAVKVAHRRAKKQIAPEVAARKKAEKRLAEETKAREKAEQRAILAEEQANRSTTAQRQPYRQPQPIDPKPLRQEENAHPSPSTKSGIKGISRQEVENSRPSSSTPTKGNSSPRRSGCLWLLALPGLSGLLPFLGSFVQ